MTSQRRLSAICDYSQEKLERSIKSKKRCLSQKQFRFRFSTDFSLESNFLSYHLLFEREGCCSVHLNAKDTPPPPLQSLRQEASGRLRRGPQ